MVKWLGKLLELGHRVSRKQEAKAVQEIASKIEAKVENKVESKALQSVKSKSLGEQLDYGKWYYGVDTSAEPTVRRFTGGIEKRYPCKDGGELVINYVKRADQSYHLDITKTGNPKDINRGDWYRGFYSDIAVKNYKDRFGNDAEKVVKKKGARKQVLSTANGRVTEEEHVPLKRWQRITDFFNSGKKENSDINSWNPKDFDRFCD